MPNPTRYFEIANHYLGWGEPRGGLWFIGLEEATQWEVDDLERLAANPVEVKPHAPHDGTFSKFGRNGQAIRAITSKIAFRLSRSHAHTDWSVYQRHQLWQPGCGLAQLNFYPLGKSKWREWPDHFQKRYGYSAAERRAYEARVRDTRHARISKLHLECTPQAVVCFGTDAHASAKSIFGLNDRDMKEVASGTRVYTHSDRRVILTPFFRYQHFPDASSEFVAETLRSWGVQLP